MRRFVIAVAVVITAALATAAPALPAREPSMISVSTAAAFITANTMPYTLRLYKAGRATFDGELNGRVGHYEAAVAFDDVRTKINQASLCERSGLPLNREAVLYSPGIPSTVLIVATCALTTHHFSAESGDDILALATSLMKIGSTLDWKYEGPARRDNLVIFAR